MLQENRTTKYLEKLHEALLKGLNNNFSFRINFCPIFLLTLVECEDESNVLVVTDSKAPVIREIDFQLHELSKIFNHFTYDMISVESFKIEIDGKRHLISVIDKSNFGVYFKTSKIIYDLTEYGALNAFDL
jgi:hypothetical protein